jgi:hypothetical protein
VTPSQQWPTLVAALLGRANFVPSSAKDIKMCAPNDVRWSVAAVRTSVAKFGTYSGKLSAANSITHPETDRSQRELEIRGRTCREWPYPIGSQLLERDLANVK